jgi:hypothetical protein
MWKHTHTYTYEDKLNGRHNVYGRKKFLLNVGIRQDGIKSLSSGIVLLGNVLLAKYPSVLGNFSVSD